MPIHRATQQIRLKILHKMRLVLLGSRCHSKLVQGNLGIDPLTRANCGLNLWGLVDYFLLICVSIIDSMTEKFSRSNKLPNRQFIRSCVT